MLDKVDLFEIDKRTKKTIDKAISDNNIKLFNVLATKKDLENYATIEDLRRSTDTIMNVLDKIYGVVKRNDEEQTVIGHSVKNHEVRIAKLEKLVLSN